ncbi:MAG: alpha/beta hydrolase [Candidatus Methanogaster sp.]|uniref:Alpha/beta hydrolase n=1 Tax=Candidatus Methanogaster sp. TaxID=3386292 RepID=A0AC61L6K9_9EURY|nr:MAG: alpha/beta hydrolase [ANME-2 cluster archaeon]
MRTLRDDNILKLPDGRQLGYAEYGDPDGKPVILFHGNPNSRLLYGLIPGCPFRPGLHLIAPDRPGYGLSDFYPPGRGVADYPYDIVALADALGIDKFAVFGPSGGGPSALACAWKIPERLTAVGIFGSVGPFTPQSAEGINPGLRVLFRLAPRAPWIPRLQMGLMSFLIHHFLDLYLKLIYTELTDSDKEIHIRLGLREVLRPDRYEGFRQGGRASAYDITLAGRWPIPLEEISMKVHLWQGEDDKSVGGMGRYIAEKLPDCQATFIPNTGHFWLFEHMGEMLDVLVPRRSQRIE